MDHVLDPPALTRAKPTVADVVWLIAVVSVWLIAESGRSGGLRRHCWKNACCCSEANSQTNRKHLLEEEKAADMYDVIIFYR